MQEYKLYIDGEFCDSASKKTLDSTNPATEAPWARVARADREDTKRAIKAARRAFDEGPWARTSQADRAAILNQIASGLEARAQEIAVVETNDSGGTIRLVSGLLRELQPASVRTCVLLHKKLKTVQDVRADYVGFEIPDEFVVGYGLDYAERYRNLPFVGTLKPEVYRGR